MNSESNMTVGEKGNAAPIQGHATPYEKYDYTKATRESLGVTKNKEGVPIDRERGKCLMLFGDDLRFLVVLGKDIYEPVMVALLEWYTRSNATLQLEGVPKAVFEKLLKAHLDQSEKYALKCEKNSEAARKRAVKQTQKSTKAENS